jgi:hypothetical protein
MLKGFHRLVKRFTRPYLLEVVDARAEGTGLGRVKGNEAGQPCTAQKTAQHGAQQQHSTTLNVSDAQQRIETISMQYTHLWLCSLESSYQPHLCNDKTYTV